MLIDSYCLFKFFIFNCDLSTENCYILIEIALNFVPKGLIGNQTDADLILFRNAYL